MTCSVALAPSEYRASLDSELAASETYMFETITIVIGHMMRRKDDERRCLEV